MKNVRRIFLSAMLGLGLGGYALAFGDAGLLVQRDLHRDLARLEQEKASLQRENRALNERLAALQEDPDRIAGGDSGGRGRSVILKFEPGEGGAAVESQELSLTEARALFLSGIFCLTAFGYYALRRLDPQAGAGTLI